MGTAATIDLTQADYGDLGLGQKLPVSNLVPEGFNVAKGKNQNSDALGLGGVIVVNEVRGRVEASVAKTPGI